MSEQPKEPANPKASTQSEQNLAWPLQADRLAIKDPLLECLQIMAGHYGRRISVNGLAAGLPIPKSGITPSLFKRAAERANLNARLVAKSLAAIAIAPNLPCVLVLEAGQACILKGVATKDGKNIIQEKDGKKTVAADTTFSVSFPETPDETQDITIAELAKLMIERGLLCLKKVVTGSGGR